MGDLKTIRFIFIIWASFPFFFNVNYIIYINLHKFFYVKGESKTKKPLIFTVLVK